MNENIQEIISPSGNYKATIFERPNYYNLEIYILSEDFEPETGVIYGEYWSRQNTASIIIEKGYHAGEFAIHELRSLMGEPDSQLSIEWIRDFSFCKDAKFLNPKDINVFSEWINAESNEKNLTPIEAKTIIDFAGLCLVEEIGCNDEWQMGQIDDNGRICCWGEYGKLKNAIEAL